MISHLIFGFIIIWLIATLLPRSNLGDLLVLYCELFIYRVSQSRLEATKCIWLVRGSICILNIVTFSKLSTEIKKSVFCRVLTVYFIWIFSWPCFLPLLLFVRHRYSSFIYHIITNFFVLNNLTFFLTIHSVSLNLFQLLLNYFFDHMNYFQNLQTTLFLLLFFSKNYFIFKYLILFLLNLLLFIKFLTIEILFRKFIDKNILLLLYSFELWIIWIKHSRAAIIINELFYIL